MVIISFSFLRSAIGTQQTPPNIVLIGIALFLTYFTMQPVFTQIRTEAYEPYAAEEISQEEFLSRAEVPLKGFMLRNTKTTTLTMFCDLAHIDAVSYTHLSAILWWPRMTKEYRSAALIVCRRL